MARKTHRDEPNGDDVFNADRINFPNGKKRMSIIAECLQPALTTRDTISRNPSRDQSHVAARARIKRDMSLP